MTIENLSKSWRLWSVQLAAILGIIAAFEPHWPALSKALPPHWVEIGAALIVIARILRQGPPPPPSSPDEPSGPSANGPGDSSPPSLSSLAVAGVVCFCVTGCFGEPRHPERDRCYLAADAEAARRYMDECGSYQDTRECPTGDAIEAGHQAAQEACK